MQEKAKKARNARFHKAKITNKSLHNAQEENSANL